MTVLCATDFSPSSQQATKLAIALARKSGDSVTFVHAVEPLLHPVPGVAEMAAWEAGVKDSVETLLAALVKELRDAGIGAEGHVVIGSAATTILNAVQDHSPRLVVMGTHGRKVVARLFLGSVATSVVKSAGCPVLVTRAGDTLSERWTGGHPLRLAVGVDGTRASEAALAWAGALPEQFSSKPVVVRLYWPTQEAIRYGLEVPWLGEPAPPELLPLLDRDTRQLTTRYLQQAGAPAISFCLAHVNAAEQLSTEASRLGADAVVVAVPARRQQAWNAVATADVLRTAAVPVFCIPEGTQQVAATTGIPVIRSVLVATDLSDLSNRAVLAAYGVVPPGGRVELCHVHVAERRDTQPVDFPTAPRFLPPPLADERRNALTAQLRALVPPEAESRGIVSNVSVVGAPAAGMAILQAAERLAVDVIALASHGRSGIKRAVLGSVTEEVTRHSDRPVLVVHPRPA